MKYTVLATITLLLLKSNAEAANIYRKFFSKPVEEEIPKYKDWSEYSDSIVCVTDPSHDEYYLEDNTEDLSDIERLSDSSINFWSDADDLALDLSYSGKTDNSTSPSTSYNEELKEEMKAKLNNAFLQSSDEEDSSDEEEGSEEELLFSDEERGKQEFFEYQRRKNGQAIPTKL